MWAIIPLSCCTLAAEFLVCLHSKTCAVKNKLMVYKLFSYYNVMSAITREKQYACTYLLSHLEKVRQIPAQIVYYDASNAGMLILTAIDTFWLNRAQCFVCKFEL